MTGVAIYMEGGGNSKEERAQLRQGMDAFLSELKDRARSMRWSWKLTACGGRREAYDAFRNANLRADDDEVMVLLVDSEDPVIAKTRADHLRTRQGDGWDLDGVDEASVQLMIQTMETWIVADLEALATYYGQKFNQNILPKHQDLEGVPKATIENDLQRATQPTQKGRYLKIRHASALLQAIDPAKVRVRCPSCERMFVELGRLLGQR